jgi:hypothetical protein
MSSYYPSSYLISFYSYIFLPLSLLLSMSATSPSIYTGVIPLAFYPFVCGLSVLRTTWIVSLLFCICTIFLPIRTGAIPPTYFLYVLSFSLFVRGLSLPLIFYMYLSFSLFVRGLSLLLTFYMYCLSLYSYGGYSSYLFSTWAVHSVYVATVEFILEYILEMKSLT